MDVRSLSKYIYYSLFFVPHSSKPHVLAFLVLQTSRKPLLSSLIQYAINRNRSDPNAKASHVISLIWDRVIKLHRVLFLIITQNGPRIMLLEFCEKTLAPSWCRQDA